ncbi:hypothetical protein GALMADRAFT_135441 [Galerina marginata CBS 339.88]|uniref:Uncharacterized protein n=1 Tax=Galerina marginata (strain CBS 339.88) TaxID=685588 RepID=A0A067TFT3_GALM3|nr:hypothetical protein GALMADRAFT_135441 [Galerina marginata CBS 339.88]
MIPLIISIDEHGTTSASSIFPPNAILVHLIAPATPLAIQKTKCTRYEAPFAHTHAATNAPSTIGHLLSFGVGVLKEARDLISHTIEMIRREGRNVKVRISATCSHRCAV